MPKWLIFMILAIIANSGFAIFWKKSMAVASPALFAMVVGIILLIFGFAYYFISGGNLVTATTNNLWPLFICAIIDGFFYIFYSKVLTTQGVSQAYPFSLVRLVQF